MGGERIPQLTTPVIGFLLDRGIESDNPIDQEDVRKTFSVTRARINRKLEDAGLPEKFQIVSRGERGALRYGLGIPAKSIVWG